ncbi:MAG: hypothetical protein AB7K24_02080 [Gemmataceae bacterium]
MADFDFPSGEETTTAAAAKPKRGQTRHALGMPAGSVRAILAFLILGLIWALIVMRREVPLYLQFLMFIVLGHYFGTRAQSAEMPDTRGTQPLWMPRGIVRTLIFFGFLAVAGAVYYQHKDNITGFVDNLKGDQDIYSRYLPLLIAGGFFFGMFASMVGRMIGGQNGMPPWYQDLQAWIALLAMIGLGVAIVIHFIINPSLESSGDNIIKLPSLEQFLAAVVGFYFGARS